MVQNSMSWLRDEVCCRSDTWHDRWLRGYVSYTSNVRGWEWSIGAMLCCMFHCVLWLVFACLQGVGGTKYHGPGMSLITADALLIATVWGTAAFACKARSCYQ